MKLLTMVPTRGRPKRLAEMIDSFYATRTGDTQLIIYLNDDDPLRCDYKIPHACKVITGPRKFLAHAYNYLFEKYPNYDYYSAVNDDHVFLTPAWDVKLISIINELGHGWGLAAAEDHLTNWYDYEHPSGMVISGNIPRALGYLIWPEIQHIGIDCFFMHLMRGIKRLFFTPDVVIEHRHWSNGKALLDANYRWVYSHEQYCYGMTKVEEYMAKQYFIDLHKLKQAMIRGGDKIGEGGTKYNS